MVSVIKQYQGTIDEFIGDAIFVLFGAPVWQEDDAQRAVACAVATQLAMASINEQNRQEDLPEIEWHRRAQRPSGGGKYRIAGADEIWRGRKPRQLACYLRIISQLGAGERKLQTGSWRVAGRRT